jgi:hypothetical protein
MRYLRAFPRSPASSDRAPARRPLDVPRPLQRADVRGLGGSERAGGFHRFPELAKLQDNWETIRGEAVELFEGFIRAAAKNNDWGFYSFFKSGWKRFYLKWYDDFLPSART